MMHIADASKDPEQKNIILQTLFMRLRDEPVNWRKVAGLVTATPSLLLHPRWTCCGIHFSTC